MTQRIPFLSDSSKTGKGKIILRAKLHVEDEGGKKNIVVTEIPYQVNKADLIISLSLDSAYVFESSTISTTSRTLLTAISKYGS